MSPYLLIGQSDRDCKEIFTYQHPIKFDPQIYNANPIDSPVIIDGKLDDPAWQKAKWSNEFVDIEGAPKPTPSRQTRMKITYDKDYLYIGAKLEEDHLWYTLTQKDDIIFYDDDFEIFIDPDGDGHNYLEIEINEYNAVWDLFLMFPYRNKSKHNHIMNWEVKGLKTAVHLEGTANDPADVDEYWSVECAIPWSALIPFSATGQIPRSGEYWRIDFSRVDWLMKTHDGSYTKQLDSDGKNLPERNWVWSPTGYINMHRPEDWGYLFFDTEDKTDVPRIEIFKRTMWNLFHAINDFHQKNDRYPENLKCIGLNENDLDLKAADYTITSGVNTFEVVGAFENEIWTINKGGHLNKLR